MRTEQAHEEQANGSARLIWWVMGILTTISLGVSGLVFSAVYHDVTRNTEEIASIKSQLAARVEGAEKEHRQMWDEIQRLRAQLEALRKR